MGIRPVPKPVARSKVDPRYRAPHRFEEAHDDPAPASVCWYCYKPRDAKVHQGRAPMRRTRMRKGARGTAHSRRPRNWGFMSFARERGCELRGDAELQRILGIRHDCEGPIQFAHLSDKRRYDPAGDIGAGLCRDAAHQGIDGKIGGKAPWYVVLDYTGQHMARMRLANRARAAWDALTDAGRDGWEARAAAQRGRS